MRRGSWRTLTRSIITAASVWGGVLCFASSAQAWGCKGHQAIALIAEQHLNPRALAAAKKILADAPIDPNLSRYCKEGGSDPFADASTWPDDIRPLRPETVWWHFIDIPLSVTHREVARYCPQKEGCVISAIADEMKTLRSPGADPQKRAEALRFLIHFVGDMHQPLHAVSNNDLGGNCVPVAFFAEQPALTNPDRESYFPNLHAVWDTNIIERATPGKTSDQIVEELDTAFAKKIARWERGPVDLDAWVWESHQVGAKRAYAKLPAHIQPEAFQVVTACTEDNHVAQRMLKLNEQLGAPYESMGWAIARERLAQAGARLALILNELWL